MHGLLIMHDTFTVIRLKESKDANVQPVVETNKVITMKLVSTTCINHDNTSDKRENHEEGGSRLLGGGGWRA